MLVFFHALAFALHGLFRGLRRRRRLTAFRRIRSGGSFKTSPDDGGGSDADRGGGSMPGRAEAAAAKVWA